MSFWDNSAYGVFGGACARRSGDLDQLTPYAYATFEGIHLDRRRVFFGAVFLLDLRLLGLMPQLLAGPTGRFLLGIWVPAFALLAVSGVLLFVPSADRYATSPISSPRWARSPPAA